MSATSREVVQRMKALAAVTVFVTFGMVISYLALAAGSWGWLVWISGLAFLALIYLLWPILRTFRYGLKNRPKRAA